MRWLKRDLVKNGITIAVMLPLLVLTAWLPVSATDVHEMTSGLASPVTGIVQATPTVDMTVTALNKEKLAQEVQQLKNQNEPDPLGWLRTNASILLSTLVVVIGGLIGLFRWLGDRRDEQEKRQEDQRTDREKRDEDRFQTAIAGLGSQDVQARIGAAVMLRTFLKPGYEQFHEQIFALAVANLRLPPSADSSTDPDLPDPLSQELMLVFKESYPLARKQLEQESVEKGYTTVDYKSLNASSVQLNNALLSRADLSHAYMVKASLKKATLNEADLKETDLESANLDGAYLLSADLTGANLRFADLTEANFRGADLSGADLYRATLTDSKLENAKSLKGTQMYDVKGLSAEQQEECKRKGVTFGPSHYIPPPAFA